MTGVLVLVRQRLWAGLHAALSGSSSRKDVAPEFKADGDPVAELSNRSLDLLDDFERTQDPAVLDEAIELGRDALRAVPETHPYKSFVLSNLSLALEARFLRTMDLTTLDEATELIRAAIRTTPDDDLHRPSLLYNLGNSLWRRFHRTGGLKDLDEAVGVYRAAFHATPDDDPRRARRGANLGKALESRFTRTGDRGDLDEAVELLRAALGESAGNDPDHHRALQGLALALQKQFDQAGRRGALDEAVELLRAAARAAPHDPLRRATCLSNLGVALRKRFEHTWQLEDLDEAIKVGRGAVRAVPDEHFDTSLILSQLVGSLVLRFEHTGQAKALDEAVAVGRDAVRLTPEDDPGISSVLTNLGSALKARHVHNGAERDRTEALSVWEKAAGTAAAPSIRINAARAAGNLAASSDPRRAADLLERAVLLLPEVAPRRLNRDDQQQALVRTRRLAADAIAHVLADSRMETGQRAMRALGLAEAGRAVLLSRTLDARSDLSELRQQHPALAARFSELRDLLDQSNTATTTLTGTSQTELSGDERHRLAAELDAVMERIRGCKGFAAFGRPPTLEDLLPEAVHGPVVTFNVNHHRSDALLLTRHGVSSCPLPRLTVNETLGQVDAFHRALDEASTPAGDRVSAQRVLRQVLEWLWDAAAEPVLSALASLGELGNSSRDGEPLPRVWWTLAGPLGELPLHAAGHHTELDRPGGHRRTVMDRVISSYTPTIHTLHHTRRHLRPSSAALRSLLVAMPDTPGLDAPLRHVREEARRVQACLPHPVQLTGPEPGGACRPDTPTAAAVRSQLPHCAIAHFACHGVSDTADPSQSRLLLYDHSTSPLTVSALAQLDLSQGQLAYLSACSTASPGDRQLSDEAIHLASACQLAGFSHVIGTLWPINDRLAVDIAESFYTYLAAGPDGHLVTDRAAVALHRTIRDLRDRYPGLPSLWAAYLHVGA